MDSATISLFNQLTLAAAALIAVGFLWRRLIAVQDKAEKDHEIFNNNVLYDLKARIMVVEDKLEIDRQDRMKYLPAASDKEQKILLDLDGKKPHEQNTS
jgi:hypothetical protein